MAKKIIHFIRSAENLENSIGSSISIAKTLGYEIKLLMILESRHTFFYPMTSPLKTGLASYEFEMIREERMKEEEKQIREFLDQQPEVENIPAITYDIRSGATDMILIEESEKDDTAMILVNEAEEPELGFIINTYMNILEKISCPLLKVPEEFELGKIRKILYATDYKEEDIPTLSMLAEFAAPFGGEITALHITDSVDLEEKLKSHGFESSIQEKAGYHKIEFAIREDKSVVNGILEYTGKGNFDLVVLLKENRNFLKRIFTKSDSNRMLKESDIPVMIYREPAK